jgi:hypothetical protein
LRADDTHAAVVGVGYAKSLRVKLLLCDLSSSLPAYSLMNPPRARQITFVIAYSTGSIDLSSWKVNVPATTGPEQGIQVLFDKDRATVHVEVAVFRAFVLSQRTPNDSMLGILQLDRDEERRNPLLLPFSLLEKEYDTHFLRYLSLRETRIVTSHGKVV